MQCELEDGSRERTILNQPSGLDGIVAALGKTFLMRRVWGRAEEIPAQLLGLGAPSSTSHPPAAGAGLLQQLSTQGAPPTRQCGKSFAPTAVAALSIWERQERKRG